MKTLSVMLILVLSLYFAGCSTQTGGSPVSSVTSMSETSVQSTSGSGGNHEGNTGPDASDSEIAWGHHN